MTQHNSQHIPQNSLELLLEAASKYDWMFADIESAEQLGIYLTCGEVDALLAMHKIRKIPGKDPEWVANHRRHNPECHSQHGGAGR